MLPVTVGLRRIWSLVDTTSYMMVEPESGHPHLLGRYLYVGLRRIWPPSLVGTLPVICWVEENLATLTCWDATSYLLG